MHRPARTLIIVSAIAVFFPLFLSSFASASDLQSIDTPRLHTLIMGNVYDLEAGRPLRHVVVDARPRADYDESHIATAVSIPETDLERSSALLPRDKNELLVVYGNDVNAEVSRKWAAKAAAAGYRNIVVYSEGFIAWKRDRLPVAPLTSGMGTGRK